MGEWIKTIGSFASAGLAIVAFSTLIIKPIRTKVGQWIRSATQTDKYDEQMDNLTKQVDEIAQILKEHVKEDAAFNAMMEEAISELKHGNMYSLGEIIRSIYMCNKEKQCISERQRELVRKIYDLYHDKWHGNGIIEDFYSEICNEWETLH